jgi:hypothetical protein
VTFSISATTSSTLLITSRHAGAGRPPRCRKGCSMSKNLFILILSIGVNVIFDLNAIATTNSQTTPRRTGSNGSIVIKEERRFVPISKDEFKVRFPGVEWSETIEMSPRLAHNPDYIRYQKYYTQTVEYACQEHDRAMESEEMKKDMVGTF